MRSGSRVYAVLLLVLMMVREANIIIHIVNKIIRLASP